MSSCFSFSLTEPHFPKELHRYIKRHSDRKTAKISNINKLLSYQLPFHTKKTHQNFKTTTSKHMVILPSPFHLSFSLFINVYKIFLLNCSQYQIKNVYKFHFLFCKVIIRQQLLLIFILLNP